MTAIGYVRVSSDKQGDGDGPDRQREAIAAWCGSRGHVLDRVFEDIGVSGASLDRPALAEALEYAKANAIELLVVENADRWARDLMVGETLLADWREVGVKVIAASGDTDLTENNDPTAKLIRQVLGASAEYAKSITVARMKLARKKKAIERGYYASRRPEPRGEATKEIIRLGKQGHTFEKMSYMLNAKGLRTTGYTLKKTGVRVPGVEWNYETVRQEWKRYATDEDKAERELKNAGL